MFHKNRMSFLSNFPLSLANESPDSRAGAHPSTPFRDALSTFLGFEHSVSPRGTPDRVTHVPTPVHIARTVNIVRRYHIGNSQ